MCSFWSDGSCALLKGHLNMLAGQTLLFCCWSHHSHSVSFAPSKSKKKLWGTQHLLICQTAQLSTLACFLIKILQVNITVYVSVVDISITLISLLYPPTVSLHTSFPVTVFTWCLSSGQSKYQRGEREMEGGVAMQIQTCCRAQSVC